MDKGYAQMDHRFTGFIISITLMEPHGSQGCQSVEMMAYILRSWGLPRQI